MQVIGAQEEGTLLNVETDSFKGDLPVALRFHDQFIEFVALRTQTEPSTVTAER